ncbi:MATE family efflux transporter [Clostridia bacterium]|nr:MATE family efflux transporter [Clostridia bacterium]
MEKKENKMGTMPVNKLLLSMSVPMMISMLVQALYNIVDSAFVSQISGTAGQDALNALSLSFPIQSLMIAVSTGTAVGFAAFLSKKLGEKDFLTANKAAMNGIFLEICGAALFLIIGLTLPYLFFSSQTENTTIIGYGKDYLSIICCFSIALFMQVGFERMLSSTGRTFFSMITQIVGALTNIFLDWVLIFGNLGAPKLEVKGAAIATIIGQATAATLAIIFNVTINHDIKLRFRKPEFMIIKQIYAVGLPTILMQTVGSLMVFGVNMILISFTEAATAVFGVFFKLQGFVFMPLFGLNNGMVPIIAYNFGAGKNERITKTIRLAATYAISLGLIGFAVFQIMPDKLLAIFGAQGEMLDIGIPALRTISIIFIVAGFSIVSISTLQALGRGFDSLIISFARQIVVLLPAAFGLSMTGDVNMIWWAFPIAELVAVSISAVLLRRTFLKYHLLKPRETESRKNN